MPPTKVAWACGSRSLVVSLISSAAAMGVGDEEDYVKSVRPVRSTGPTRSDHLSERRLLRGIHRDSPVRLDPYPPVAVLAPVAAVRRPPRFRPLVPFVWLAPASVL